MQISYFILVSILLLVHNKSYLVHTAGNKVFSVKISVSPTM